jgi:hypothetical protein
MKIDTCESCRYFLEIHPENENSNKTMKRYSGDARCFVFPPKKNEVISVNKNRVACMYYTLKK